MTDLLRPKNSPRRHTVRAEALTFPNSLRAYRESPASVAVQIRLAKDYVSASLSFDEARQFGQMIIDAANETVGTVPAPTNWDVPKYPGDTVRIAAFFKNKEVGDVRIQWYGETSARVGAFLPGIDVCLPGDSAKTEPNKAEWCRGRAAADNFFDLYCKLAIEDGWVFHAGGYRAIYSEKLTGE